LINKSTHVIIMMTVLYLILSNDVNQEIK